MHRPAALTRPAAEVSALYDWGSTAAERTIPLPCDDLLPGARCRLHRAVSVDAPVSVVYRWLCQLSLAPYSYDLIDNRGRRSPRELVAGAERFEPGQRFMSILFLSTYAPGDHLTLANARTAVTYAVREDRQRVRLVVRMLFAPPRGRIGAALLGPALAAGDLVMMRRQLLNLKALSERDARRRPGS